MTEPSTISIGHYLSYSPTQGEDSLSAPGTDFSLGLHRRFELSSVGAVRYSHDDQGRLIAERDDSYLGLKILLVSEGSYRPAVALKPTLELLGGSDRPHLVLPAILQKNVGFCDLASTAGYVTRSVAFSSLKCEWSVGKGLTPIAVVQVSRMTKDFLTMRDLGWNRTEVDTSLGLNIDLSPHWGLFLEAGRTLGPMDLNRSRFGFTASITHTGRLWGRSEKVPYQRIPARP